MGRPASSKWHREDCVRRSRPCPVCGTPSDSAAIFLESNVDETRINSFSFASRKTPEFMNHKLVRCPICDLVYVSEPPEQAELATGYREADYDSSEEAEDAAVAYISAMRRALESLPTRTDALEIGTGTGALLDHLHIIGFRNLVGFEPSTAAIASAPPHRQEWIRPITFEEHEFDDHSFDLVCCFMTLEHVLDPKELADGVLRLLRPGGAFVTVTHDCDSRVNTTLGRRSPIIDIEHMQLFSRTSIVELLARSGYQRISVAGFKNRYALRYWWRLLPLPEPVRRAGAALLRVSRVDRLKITLNVGNTMAIGYAPTVAPSNDTK